MLGGYTDARIAEGLIMPSPMIYITKENAKNLFEGTKMKRFSNWSKLGKTRYLTICDVLGVEVIKKDKYLYDIPQNKKYKIKRIEYATLDDEHYFLRIIFDEKEMNDIFIPILG